ncbi:hypothetical protein CHEID_10590 (plasmid) [Corynebacterium heidelbergense]|nr:hypothetical protein CHEID_03100 [Corynebacterium heidelbergense]WCZ37635.1 hypothetical protein CHEID_10590 [Corynebacterium heidelbergense]
MSRARRAARSRVIETKLPTERLYRPARGDWSRWEAIARAQHARALRRGGIA